MRKIIILSFVITFLTQAFAGILENRATGETLEFNVDRSSRTVEVLSMANKVENKTIEMKSVIRGTSEIRLYGITEDACYGIWGGDLNTLGCVIIPVIGTPGLIIGAVETLMIPFKATAKLLQNMKMKKDFKKLMRAINSTNTIVVSNKRFRRIENLLQ